VEASAVHQTGAAGIHGRSPLLRLQSDERLIALVRRGNSHAFEALVGRYQSRLLAFCRHMLSSKEDAEDVLQEVFAAAFNAILADEREINVRPWLYRIARNRSLNHLRRTQAVGVDSMDIHLSEGGLTTADKVHKREEFRLLIADVQDLPETQRTALLLREIDALSYEQIAEAMETTVPSVKSLLVRARVSLAEAAEARLLSCDEVRVELGAVAEGITRTTAPVRRHLRTCERCAAFRKQLRTTNKALAALYPVGPLLLLKKSLLAHLGTTAAAGGSTAAAGAGAAAGGAAAGGVVQAGVTSLATKAVAGLAAAAIVTAGAAEVKHVATKPRADHQVALAAAAPAVAPRATATPAPPEPVSSAPQPVAEPAQPKAKPQDKPKPDKAEQKPAGDAPKATPTPAAGKDGEQPANTEQRDGDTTTLPTETTGDVEQTGGSLGTQPAPPATAQPTPAPTQPAPTPAPTVTPAPTQTPAPTATPSPEPTATPEPDPTVTPSPTPAPRPTTTPEPTPTPR
jgi:RNA polymerase sigma factor (sigma-70 family)